MQFIDRWNGGLVISCSDDEGAETLRSYTYSRIAADHLRPE